MLILSWRIDVERRTNSSANIFAARETWSFGAAHSQSIAPSLCARLHVRMMSEIMDVPFPRAASRRLMSFLTFQISMFFSASLGCSFLFPDDMVAEVLVVCG
jgi:hypothetical protein